MPKSVKEILSNLDLFDPEQTDNMVEALAEARRSCPVIHTESDGGYYLVTRYEDVRSACERTDDFSNSEPALRGSRPGPPHPPGCRPAAPSRLPTAAQPVLHPLVPEPVRTEDPRDRAHAGGWPARARGVRFRLPLCGSAHGGRAVEPDLREGNAGVHGQGRGERRARRRGALRRSVHRTRHDGGRSAGARRSARRQRRRGGGRHRPRRAQRGHDR